MTDANTYFINRLCAEIDAREEAEWPLCEGCGDRVDPAYFNENGICDDCEMPSQGDIARLVEKYPGEMPGWLIRKLEKWEQELRDAGRIG